MLDECYEILYITYKTQSIQEGVLGSMTTNLKSSIHLRYDTLFLASMSGHMQHLVIGILGFSIFDVKYKFS